ncbi:MAG: TetR/AcrR family transcriptional regulator [Clostridia bacterium]|nr:TetR/AcrR family transcriptional regulator [Clostridia bacterium]
MARSGNTKSKIIQAAWSLFYEQGYDDTTVDEIIEKSGTSRGSFYHYFEGKDALLGTLSTLFDEKYTTLMDALDPDMDSFDKLMLLNRELFRMIENSVPLDLLAQLYATQLLTKGEKHLLDRNRIYYRLLRRIVMEGQEKGQLTAAASVNDIVKAYALCERSLLYDWCICNGEYSLSQYAERMMPMFLRAYRAGQA